MHSALSLANKNVQIVSNMNCLMLNLNVFSQFNLWKRPNKKIEVSIKSTCFCECVLNRFVYLKVY